MNSIPQVQNTPIVTNAEFVKLTLSLAPITYISGNIAGTGTTTTVTDIADTALLQENMTLYKKSGTGVFGSNPTIISIDSSSQITIHTDSTNTAGNIIFDAGGASNVYTFSSSYRPETIDGTTYTPLGGLLSVNTQQRDLRATSFDTAITLSGIDQTNIFYVLSSDYLIKGSKIQFWRGFYDTNFNLVNTVLRYTGIVTSYTINESVEQNTNDDSYIVTLNCSNYKTVLENRIAGRNTNPTSWRNFYPNDASMDNVPSLINAVFDFGQPAGNKGQNTSG
tara:strand:+ start:689 stop:1525 length:837 start_codon:yes stop_codon:yes gene_type:complete